ncbi:MAG: cryptochrome/photolyase family protein [Methylophilaceae bacterium]|nr:cryptochrome/photolyase family protein [Methylophilaceae bacterium]
MAIRNLIIILGDQLNLDNPALESFDSHQDKILMVEVMDEGNHVWSHKARIALFLSAMRHFAQSLTEHGFSPIYLQLSQLKYTNLSDAWTAYIKELSPQKIIVCEPGDYRVLKILESCALAANTPLNVRDDTHFMCSQADFKHWAAGGKQLRMEFFYRVMRKKHHVLMQSDASKNDQPIGGKWNFDAENRGTFGKQGPQDLPEIPSFAIDDITHAVFADVEHYFAEHPGTLVNFCWPVTRPQALKFLDDFIEKRLSGFGQYQDAMWQDSSKPTAFLWHSLLASSLNLKLLNPRVVIASAELAYKNHKVSLASVEGFIRQILGWREFIRGMYWLDMPKMATANYYQHERKLPDWYWTGNTQMNCLRQTIKQTLAYGYAHHIQRLMITGMFGVLAELNPREVEAWYLAVYVDAVEWVELPNVAGMALYANGGRFTSKPYVASGSYIKRMSNYCNGCKYKPEVKTGEDACPYTTLYWHFLIKHYDEFAHNPRTALMVKHVERFSAEDKEVINSTANDRLDNLQNL